MNQQIISVEPIYAQPHPIPWNISSLYYYWVRFSFFSFLSHILLIYLFVVFYQEEIIALMGQVLNWCAGWHMPSLVTQKHFHSQANKIMSSVALTCPSLKHQNGVFLSQTDLQKTTSIEPFLPVWIFLACFKTKTVWCFIDWLTNLSDFFFLWGQHNDFCYFWPYHTTVIIQSVHPFVCYTILRPSNSAHWCQWLYLSEK